MEISMRALWTLVHGMGFGAFYLLACSGAIVELWRRYAPSAQAQPGTEDERFFRVYLLAMVVLAWFAVLSGAYIVYPWYRALPPPGTTNLAGFPQKLLMSNPATIGWHSLGMEWKEHVAWLAPIAVTMAAVVFFEYGRDIRRHPQLRNAVLGFVCISLVAAGVAGFFGAEIDEHAPVKGGAMIQILKEGQR